MAAAANPSTITHSSGNSGDGSFLSDHQSKGSIASRGVSSPWTLVVRGSESEVITSTVVPLRPLSHDSSPSKAVTTDSLSIFPLPVNDSVLEALPESSDICIGSNNAAKKPAWNKPSSDPVEVGPVMDAVSWPALSVSTKASSKPGSSDSLKGMPDVHVPILQIGSNKNANSRPNNLASPGEPKLGGGITSNIVTVNDSLLQSLPSQQDEVDEMSPNAGKSGPQVVESSSSKDHMHRESGQRVGIGSQSRSDQPPHYGSFRRVNGGSYPRTNGSYNHNHVGRRDQGRGNRDWNRHRSFNGRESQTQPRVATGGYVHPPPKSAPFIPPPPVPLTFYHSPMVYPEGTPPLIYVPAPLPPHPICLPVPDPLLHSRIVNQIDYYFSYENLIKDTFLRQNMDEHGWVPVQLIASFKKVRLLTDNIHLMLEALYSSSIVEVQGDKVRKRYDWPKWVMQKQIQFPNAGSSSSSQNR
ncbi:la-related protein 1C-like [Impatiens glandulifera]|uniref:la-related protein 1C-like n=1 Tax=Impatiens glandulifera TaxID=253017 RepID=UPI001FB13CE2|nr:la-related protein 1C-like [Impatiens glandulifera]